MRKRMIIESLRLKIVDPIKCPFCGKEEEDWQVDCPHFIGYQNDNGLFDWRDDFKTLDGIISSLNELYSEGDWEVDWKEIFKGIPYWEGLSDEEIMERQD